jgi:hypothetical protein
MNDGGQCPPYAKHLERRTICPAGQRIATHPKTKKGGAQMSAAFSFRSRWLSGAEASGAEASGAEATESE